MSLFNSRGGSDSIFLKICAASLNAGSPLVNATLTFFLYIIFIFVSSSLSCSSIIFWIESSITSIYETGSSLILLIYYSSNIIENLFYFYHIESLFLHLGNLIQIWYSILLLLLIQYPDYLFIFRKNNNSIN